MSVLVSRY